MTGGASGGFFFWCCVAKAQEKFWTAQDVFLKVRKHFPQPAFVVLPQVRNGTAFARRQTRTADALIASTWPSRGLWLAGVEIKVSKYDWQKELANPAKADEFQKWCRYWWIAAPEGVVSVTELPETWGLLEASARGITVTKQAPQLEPTPPDILLLCSILRNVAESFVPQSEVAALAESKAAAIAKDDSVRYAQLTKDVDEFLKESGVDLRSHSWRNGELGKAVKLVEDYGILNGQARLKTLRDEAANIVEACDKLVTP